MEYEMQLVAFSWQGIYIYMSSHAARSQNMEQAWGQTLKIMYTVIVSISPECTHDHSNSSNKIVQFSSLPL